METYISFINNTTYPSVSIEGDGRLLFKTLLRESSTPLIAYPAGSAAFVVRQNNEREFLHIWAPLAPHTEHNICITDTDAYFIQTTAL